MDVSFICMLLFMGALQFVNVIFNQNGILDPFFYNILIIAVLLIVTLVQCFVTIALYRGVYSSS